MTRAAVGCPRRQPKWTSVCGWNITCRRGQDLSLPFYGRTLARWARSEARRRKRLSKTHLARRQKDFSGIDTKNQPKVNIYIMHH